MDIESSKHQVGKEACYSNISICCAVNRMLAKILNSFSSFGPSLRNPMSAKQDSVKSKSEECVDEDMQFECFPSTT